MRSIHEAVTERDEVAGEPALCACGNGYNGHVITDYNGWRDKPTWCAALWFANDEPLYRVASAVLSDQQSQGADLVAQSRALRIAWDAYAPDMARRELATAGGAYHVDWSEIADGWFA